MVIEADFSRAYIGKVVAVDFVILDECNIFLVLGGIVRRNNSLREKLASTYAFWLTGIVYVHLGAQLNGIVKNIHDAFFKRLRDVNLISRQLATY